MLVLVIGAAAALLVSAPALGAAWLSVEVDALHASQIEHSPAIAIDPAATRAVVVADDGLVAPPPHTAAASAADWSTTWSAPVSLMHSGSTSAGQADVAWGMAGTPNVYAVELGSNSSTGSLCTGQSGVFFSASSNAGATYGSALTVAPASNSSQVVEPAIAVDRTIGRVYVAYARLEWGSTGCSGTPDSSQIWLAYDDIASPGFGTDWTKTRRVSPLATSGAARYRSPALDVLPDGRVVVAFRNDATPSPQIESETCTSPSPGLNYCNPPSAGSVGPSVVLGDAGAPGLIAGLVGAPTPSVAATVGRVVVAWHASVGNAVRAFAAMSTNGGASYGPAQQIDPVGGGSQIAPELAATAGGRVDAAYLSDTGAGVLATVASANPPLAGATTEAWAQPVVVQGVPASSATPITGQAAPLGQGLGVATAALSTPPSPLPATVVAFTDTALGGQDVRVVGLLHGTTAPVIAAQTVRASKNITTIVHVAGSDDDGDPLTWATGTQPSNPLSNVNTADAARGDFAFKAANVVGTDTFEAIATDGVAGHEARTLINVNVVNDPPVIGCEALTTREDTPLDIPIAGCVEDPNQDPLTITLDEATNGTVERVAGTWRFIPLPHSTKAGSFVLHATDGDLPVQKLVTVTIAAAVGKVTITVTDSGKRRKIARGAALRFHGTAIDAQGRFPLVTWNFGDGTPVARGSSVAHRFRREGSFTVKASASGASVSVRVLVRRRAVELVGSPRVADGVLTLQVRTRVAGTLSIRADSRSRTISVPAGSTQQTLRIQVTTGPLVRLTVRLRPAKATVLPALSLRRLVIVSPLSAG